MTLRRSDLDQAARYLHHATELLANGGVFAARRGCLDTLNLVVAKLGPGDQKPGDLMIAANITLLDGVAEKVPPGEARTSVLKAVAVLRDRSDGSSYTRRDQSGGGHSHSSPEIVLPRTEMKSWSASWTGAPA